MILTGCLNYAGMKAQSTPLTASDLSGHHQYKHSTQQASNGWWLRFHDSQLNELINIALEDSPSMQIAASRVRKTQQLTAEASSSLWPTIETSGYSQRQRFSQYGLIPPPFNGETFNINEIGLNFNYEFDFWGKHRQLVAASVSEQYASEADLAQAQLIISTAIANTFWQLQNNKEQWRISEIIVKNREEILAIIKDRHQHGLISAIPYESAMTSLEAAKIISAQYKSAIKLSLNQLATLIGKNPFETEITTKRLSYRHYQVKLPRELPANLLANRPDIKASRFRVEAEAHRINVAKARFFPNINLGALLSYESINFGKLFSPHSQNNAATGAIDLPLFDAGARRANLGEQYANYDIAVNEYNKTILKALREVSDQIAILKSVNSQLQMQNISLNAIEKNYHLTTSNYQHGIVDYIQVLNSKLQLLQQQANQAKLQTQHLQTVVAIIKALGGSNRNDGH